MNVAIIGAGMAGLSCASKLMLHGYNVEVFESQKHAGGRLYSIDLDNFQCDLGAPYFTVANAEFKNLLQAWRENWQANSWQGWLVELENSNALTRVDAAQKRYVGVPNMHNILDSWSSVCEIHYHCEIIKIIRHQEDSSKWQLLSKKRSINKRFDAVIVATTPLVAQNLLLFSPKIATQIAKVHMQPSWVAVFGFSQPFTVGFDAATVVDSAITWMHNSNSKPERHGMQAWVLQAGSEWSEKHLNAAEEQVCAKLEVEFAKAVGIDLPPASFAHAHLWRESICVNPLASGALWHKKLKIGACGDWCEAARVEGAFLSGQKMAAKLIATTFEQ